MPNSGGIARSVAMGSRDYLGFDCTDCRPEDRTTPPPASCFPAKLQKVEREILNLAVSPSARRKGVALRLLEHELDRGKGSWFLEVRESNRTAIALYESVGFRPVGRRKEYYNDSHEAGIVMSFLS